MGMICKSFPDLKWLKKQAETGFSDGKAWNGKPLEHKGWPSVIINTTASGIFRDNIKGPLSLFINISGQSGVRCDNKSAVIPDGYFYVTNQDQYYTLEIDEKKTTETFNFHFGEYWAEQTLRTLTATEEQLLDESMFDPDHNKIEFHNRLHIKDHKVNTLITNIKNCQNDLAADELMYSLLVHLLNEERHVRKIQTQLPALKSSTRHELMKRLLLASDYIHAFHHKDITLDELASVACLSKFHFLRLFKTAFKKTPHQLITEVKIEESKTLLRKRTENISAIARSLGFQNASSFSRLFYQHTGVYPSEFIR